MIHNYDVLFITAMLNIEHEPLLRFKDLVVLSETVNSWLI